MERWIPGIIHLEKHLINKCKITNSRKVVAVGQMSSDSLTGDNVQTGSVLFYDIEGPNGTLVLNYPSVC